MTWYTQEQDDTNDWGKEFEYFLTEKQVKELLILAEKTPKIHPDNQCVASNNERTLNETF